MIDQNDLSWVDTPEHGWVTMRLPHMVLEQSFVCGDSSGERLIVRYYKAEADQSLRAKVLLGPAAQGPPGHAHGGSIAALLDEAMGGAGWMAGHPSVAADLAVRFRTMLPLGTRVVIEASVVAVDGRKVRARAVLRGDQGTLYAEGDALFIKIDPSRFGSLTAEAARVAVNP